MLKLKKRKVKVNNFLLLKIARYITWTRALSTISRHWGNVYLPKHGKWQSQHLNLKIKTAGSIYARKNPKQQYLKIVTLNDPFDEIRTYFVQVLRDCQQITFVTPNGFCLLSNNPLLPPPPPLTDNITMARILSKFFYIVSIFEGTSYQNL